MNKVIVKLINLTCGELILDGSCKNANEGDQKEGNFYGNIENLLFTTLPFCHSNTYYTSEALLRAVTISKSGDTRMLARWNQSPSPLRSWPATLKSPPGQKKKSISIQQHDDFLYLPSLCCWSQSAHWEHRRSSTYTEGVKWWGNWLLTVLEKPLRIFHFFKLDTLYSQRQEVSLRAVLSSFTYTNATFMPCQQNGQKQQDVLLAKL